MKLKIKKLLFVAVSIFISVLAIELGLQIISFVINFNSITTIDHRIELSPYQNKKWAEQLFREQKEMKLEYYPYSGWRAIPHKDYSVFYRIDSEFKNRTNVNNYNQSELNVKHIWVFGGSSVWGVYQRTEKTIPSLLSELSYQAGKKYFVENMGQLGFSYSQNIIDLIQQLKLGKRPDFVVFYIGANNILGSYSDRKSDTVPLVKEFNDAISLRRSNYFNQLFETTKLFIIENSKIYKSIDILASSFGENKDEIKLNVGDKIQLEREMHDVFKYNTDFVVNLSRIYGFDFQIILQPILFFKNPKSIEESDLKFDPSCSDSVLEDFSKKSYEQIKSLKLSNLSDFSDSLDQFQGTAFVDLVHISEEANELIAKQIFELIDKKVK